MGESDLNHGGSHGDDHGDNPGPDLAVGIEVDSRRTRVGIQVDVPHDASFTHPSPELLALVVEAICECQDQDQRRWLPKLDEVVEAIAQYQTVREEERRQRARERRGVADAGPPATAPACRLRRGRGHRDFRRG